MASRLSVNFIGQQSDDSQVLPYDKQSGVFGIAPGSKAFAYFTGAYSTSDKKAASTTTFTLAVAGNTGITLAMIKGDNKAFDKSSLLVEVGDENYITKTALSPIVLNNASASDSDVTRYAISDASLNMTGKDKKEINKSGVFCFNSDSNKLFTYRKSEDLLEL